MFENIHFIRKTLSSPVINEHMIASIIDEYLDQNSPDYTGDIKKDFNLPWDASFNMEGTYNVIAPSVVSTFAQTSLFYVQSFSVFDMTESYFTRRKDYSSYEIVYSYDGLGYLEYDEKCYELKPGDGFFIDCRKPHFYKTATDRWHHCVFHFDGPLAEYYFNEFSKEGNVNFHMDFNHTAENNFQAALEKLASAYDSIGAYKDLQVSLAIEGILVLLLTHGDEYNNARKKIPENLVLLVRYINNNYANHLTLDYLSDFSNYSKYYLCRLFKEYIGYSPTEYIINLRIDHAKEYLRSNNLPANKIGVLVGISNTNYFYRIFKKMTGFSPDEFRKRY
ncbi:helix-turn-helix domain-containing protein [Clostridium luticellarii]|uniref:Bifunctional transcriptional activator/DNA repair enzyme AdaA n=1 Tax=Clostridium luticellarii TaxID=1691940 RepID=A0A2T0BLA5_9CLOT|nr:AraC family transcriptional regulator [Clostridium luticellarii]PRR84661.1 Bifunctional transcriptional activator/DNA repair enzyme AdaA [Clostridium luticellarii]